VELEESEEHRRGSVTRSPARDRRGGPTKVKKKYLPVCLNDDRCKPREKIARTARSLNPYPRRRPDIGGKDKAELFETIASLGSRGKATRSSWKSQSQKIVPTARGTRRKDQAMKTKEKGGGKGRAKKKNGTLLLRDKREKITRSAREDTKELFPRRLTTKRTGSGLEGPARRERE